jgi:hypothetical protein
VPFLDPKGADEEDDALPGAPGLHLDLDDRRCQECRREALPWQHTCADCGGALVSRRDLPAETFPLPAHLLDDEPAGDD